jgi:hypothetical protein
MANVSIQNATIKSSIVITPSDVTDIVAKYQNGLYVTTAGNISIMYNDRANTVDTFAVPSFSTLHVNALRVMSTGTTATGIHALQFER